jgi:hypothetical protein
MKAEDVARSHSNIIDSRLSQYVASNLQVKSTTQDKVTRLLSGLIVDSDGKCKVCRENRMLLNRAFNIIRKELKPLPQLVQSEIITGTGLIETVTTEYIKWLKS